MDLFGGTQRAFEVEHTAGRLDRAFSEWKRRAGLGELDDLETLIRLCRGPEVGSRQQKDQIHVALCLQACGDKPDERAGIVLCWLFLPGLSPLFRELSNGSHADLDDLAGEIFAGFWEAASRAKPSSTHVARHLLRGARRSATRSLSKAAVPTQATEVMERAADDSVGSCVDDMADDSLERALDQGIVNRPHVELVLSSRATIAEVAARYELSLPAAQQVRHRARQRLLGWLTDL
jgi:DNA-directed RNA polymerase specialized sigma24 family protein